MKPAEELHRRQRVERTQRALLESLLELIVEKGYDRITVESILRRADVGRTAFYAHFENKQDLLFRRFDELPWCCATEGAANLFDVTFLFEHIAQSRELVGALQGTAVFDEALVRLRIRLTQSIAQILRDRFPHGDLDSNLQMTAQALAGALMQLLSWWLDAGMPETPATMAGWFAQMAERIVNA
jgi:AcrR family transcriptional regulator